MNSVPFVSVAVITYNSSRYVLETLESIKAQTYQNIELIVSDDCSTDTTVQICKEWIEKNKARFVRTQIVTVEKNTGVSANCNRAEDACQGEWVKLIAGDDLLLPNCIQDYVSFILLNNDVVYVFGKIQIFGGEKEQREFFSKNVFDYSFFELSTSQQLERLWKQGNCIPAASAFYNVLKTRDLSLRYDERIPFLEDYPRWINALQKGIHLFFLEKETVKYRIGTLESLTTSTVPNMKAYESTRLFDLYYKFDDLYSTNKQKAFQYIIDYEIQQQQETIKNRNKYLSVLESNAFHLGCFLLQPIYWIKRVYSSLKIGKSLIKPK